MNKYKIYTDGGARGNPGPAAGGVVVFDEDGKLIALEGKYFGKLTNNQAEYEALILALEIITKKECRKVVCYLDSELIVKQMNGEYKIKNTQIKRYKKKIDKLTKEIEEIEYKHVFREKNTYADKLVNIVLDARD